LSELDELIEFEQENTSLELKREQYLKPNYEELLKDIMAMANATISGDRHIIVGVKLFPDGTRKFWSIKRDEFIDSATYQQLVRENIEPEIPFEYSPYEFEEHLFGVFRIHDCNDQPYLMRKKFGQLQVGDGWIRKGTHKTRLTRRDYDRIRERQKHEFAGSLQVNFDAPGGPNVITLPALGEVLLPSDIAAEKIRSILAEREKPAEKGDSSLVRYAIEAGFYPGHLFGPRPYEQRSSNELRQNLERVKDTYRDDDLHELYEVLGSKVNLILINEGENYVEDASIRIRIKKVDGLRIAKRIYPAPDHSGPFGTSLRISPGLLGRNYPSVSNHEQYISVRGSIGNLRHGIPTLAFDEPLRLVLEKPLVGQKVILECEVFGKQLPKPRKTTLTIDVVPTGD